MACASPLRIKNMLFDRNHIPLGYNRPYFEAPCGWCLNCRIDKRNALEFECFQEYKKFDGFSAFVTLTYDDYSLIHCLRRDSSGNLVASLVHKDVQDFLKRLRRNLETFLKTHKESKACSKNFKVVYVGEYGENGSVFDRPHWHLLFFGLDYSMCSSLISKAWRDTWYNSLCDVKPLLNGGIRYVLKYCDKQIFGKLAENKYDMNNLERPRLRRSRYFAFDYYLSHIDEIRKNHYCVKFTHNKLIPIRSYIFNRLFGVRRIDTESLEAFYRDTLGIGLDKRLSLMELNEVRHQQALLKNINLTNTTRLHGTPVMSLDQQHRYLSDDHLRRLKDKFFERQYLRIS